MRIAESFGQSVFARFLNGPLGRLGRVVAGIGLITWGYTRRDSAMLIFVAVGLVPFATGAFDQCLISAMLGGPMSGARIRRGTRQF